MKKLNNYLFIIFAIFLFHIINNFIILKQDKVPLFFDEDAFYNWSVRYYRDLFSSLKINEIIHQLSSISTFYPPLAFIERIPFYIIWGVSQDVSVLANLFFLFIFIYSVFLIGKRVSSIKTGLLAAFLVSFYPAIYGFSRTNFLTIPVAASVAVSLYLLLRTEYFINRRFSILFGISMGFGLLIKWLYLIYIFPSMLICIFEYFKKHNRKNFGRAFINFLIAIAVGIVVALPWYLPNIKRIVSIMFSACYDNPSWVNFKMYLRTNPFRLNLIRQIVGLEHYQLYTFYTILFIYFLFRYIIFKSGTIKWILLTALSIPYLIFSIAVVEYYSGAPNPRYIIPLFTLAAVITADGVMKIKKNMARRMLIISIVLFGIAQFYWTWIFYDKVAEHIYTKEDFHDRTTGGLLSPKKIDWKVDEIINTLKDNCIASRTSILIIPHTPLTSALASNLELNKEINLMFPSEATFVDGNYALVPLEKYKDLVEAADFVLTQEGGELSYDDSVWIKDNINALVKQFENQKNEFSLLKELEVGIDEAGVRILIYRRNNQGENIADLFEPEGEGILINAVDFYKGNLVYHPEFGLLLDGGVSPAYVIYEVILPRDGNYELWVRYATREVRPVEIYIDDILIKSEALIKFTRGWYHIDSRWFKESEIRTKKGKHTLKFVAKKTPFPHIDSIKIIYKSREE